MATSLLSASLLGSKKSEHVHADGHEHNDITFTEWTSDNSLPGDAGAYYLTKNVTLTSAWSPASGVRLCLNGFGIIQSAESNVISIGGNRTLNLYDCDNSIEHKFKVDETGLATVDDTFESEYETFTGGYITGGHGSSNGGGIYLVPGTSKGNTTKLYMFGGTIIGNKSNGNGGGINYPWKSKMNSVIELTDTTIIGNVAEGMAGGIFHQANNKWMTLVNTKVLRNVAGQNPGGVLEQSELNLYGDSYIYENRLKNGNPSDLNVGHSSGGQPDYIRVKDALSESAKFGIDSNRREKIFGYYSYLEKDVNEVFITHNNTIYKKDGDDASYNKVTVAAYDGVYDGEPHSMTVSVEDPSMEHEIKYGLEEGTYDLSEAPSYIENGEHRVYYKVTSKLNSVKGSVVIRIMDPAEGTKVRDQIDAISTPISYPGSVEEVKAAREAYEALFDDAQRDNVSNLNKLEEYETTLANLRADMIADLISKINEIPADYSDRGTYVAKVEAATAIYEQLAESDKDSEDITNLDKYLTALENYNNIIVATEVMDLIEEIPETITYTLDCLEKISHAKEEYDALTEVQKGLVENYEDLLAALAALEEKQQGASSSITESNVTVESGDGTKLPVDLHLSVEVKEDIKAEAGSEERANILSKIAKTEQIAKVFDVKLYVEEGGVKREVEPSEIKEGMVVVVTIDIPEGLSLDGLKVLHVHSKDDINFVDSFEVKNNKVTFETNKLSEFVFINKAPVVPGKTNGGVPGWVVALIVIGSLLLLICGAYFLLFFVFNKWIKEEDKANRVLPFALGEKDSKKRLFAFPFKVVYRSKEEIFKTKEEALK